ncbi:EF hand [Paragonimus heterotremus]|uniref:EF hand n=1 Tax=Paragonimus heterotremus TaxID=100268 RepID=A0A8J4WV25_9TREM|nr:EF hand [Paragonimus heterotremus]
MDASDESLEVVFNALDSENKGYITVEQFLSVFNEYFQETNNNGRRVSTIRSDMKKVLEALDPTNDGIIHFEDFKKAFQNEMQKVDDSANTQSTNFSPSTNPNKSGCFSDGLENKTDDSGIHTHETSIFDCDNDSSLSADGLTSSRLHRDEIRRSWPKQRGAPFLNANNPDSPVSASRSDILIDDMETNFEAIREQMRRMEERVEGIQTNQHSGTESRIDLLRDENARLTAQVTILEERLKEAEERAQRNIESERQHSQALVTRTTRDYTNQMETLRTRIHTLETECSELRIECARVKADHQASTLDRRRNSEALLDAQDQLRTLQQQMSSLEAKHAQELQILRQDRDHAVHVLEELNGSMSERRRSRIGSHSPFSSSIAGGSEVIARYQESQEIVRRLITENKSLRQQLEDAQDQLFARSLEEGRSLVGPTERSWAAEIDNCTKEEVIELYTKEKHFNEQLRKYIDSLITRIIERHPSLLEIASSTGK